MQTGGAAGAEGEAQPSLLEHDLDQDLEQAKVVANRPIYWSLLMKDLWQDSWNLILLKQCRHFLSTQAQHQDNTQPKDSTRRLKCKNNTC